MASASDGAGMRGGGSRSSEERALQPPAAQSLSISRAARCSALRSGHTRTGHCVSGCEGGVAAERRCIVNLRSGGAGCTGRVCSGCGDSRRESFDTRGRSSERKLLELVESGRTPLIRVLEGRSVHVQREVTGELWKHSLASVTRRAPASYAPFTGSHKGREALPALISFLTHTSPGTEQGHFSSSMPPPMDESSRACDALLDDNKHIKKSVYMYSDSRRRRRPAVGGEQCWGGGIAVAANAMLPVQWGRRIQYHSISPSSHSLSVSLHLALLSLSLSITPSRPPLTLPQYHSISLCFQSVAVEGRSLPQQGSGHTE
ncbi:unnamed protein product [Pleuronectes platessa]|uniref:Uncharacterized protein n=1 Tax=Pleuronectes platessa TaxID=8262 RepID=A0A9N7VCA7_PLEPL|nr:unnamed protein product [Pleuronectes platessa]